MSFAHPLALLWGLLAIPLVLLYWRRMRVPREVVATDMFWQQAFAEEHTRSTWQRWRHGMSLAVQLGLLLLAVVALAEPLIGRPRRIALVLDNSASMNATDVAPSRLAVAKEAAKRLIDSLRPCDRAAVITAGESVAVRCPMTNDRQRLRAAVNATRPTQGATRLLDALAIVDRRTTQIPNDFAATSTGIDSDETCIFTDGNIWQIRRLMTDNVAASAARRHWVRIGTSAENWSITQLNVRRSPSDPQQVTALVEVQCFADRPIECQILITLDDEPLPAIPVSLAPNGRYKHLLTVPAASGARLVATLDWTDALASDNQKTAIAPAIDDFGVSPSASLSEETPCEAPEESDLRLPDGLDIAATEIQAKQAGLPLWSWLLVMTVLGMVTQWCLYQRRWLD